MERKLDSSDAIDVSVYSKNDDGDYILPEDLDVEDVDFCDKKTEQWIWSVGKHRKTGQVLASTSSKFYQNPDFECLWLR